MDGGLYISILNVPDEGYSRNRSYALKFISTSLFATERIWHKIMGGYWYLIKCHQRQHIQNVAGTGGGTLIYVPSYKSAMKRKFTQLWSKFPTLLTKPSKLGNGKGIYSWTLSKSKSSMILLRKPPWIRTMINNIS